MYFVSELNNDVVKNKSVSHLATAVIITWGRLRNAPISSFPALDVNSSLKPPIFLLLPAETKKGALLLVFTPLSDSAASPPTGWTVGWVRRRGERRNPWVLGARVLSTASATWKRDTCRLERYRRWISPVLWLNIWYLPDVKMPSSVCVYWEQYWLVKQSSLRLIKKKWSQTFFDKRNIKFCIISATVF